MAETPLTTSPSSGSQATTQNPQVAGTSTGGGTSTGSVQPGTATSVLNQSTGLGVPLTDQYLTSVVNLNSVQTSTRQPAQPAPAPKFNPALFSVSILLFVIAVGLFWLTSKSGKKYN